ncbi:MAG: cytochrome P460 family protein [Acidobacteriota bacterium]
MQNRAIKILIMSIVVLICSSCYSEIESRSSISAAKHQADPDLEHISSYKSWTRVNKEPALHILDQQLGDRCLWVDDAGIVIDPPSDLHRDKFVIIYVNNIGKDEILSKRNPKFPVGSIIVKEKLPDKNSEKPELITVMIKREDGFNPKSGNWEYMVTDGTGKIINGRGKIKSCQQCHNSKVDTDYIFRTYLPNETKSQLK